MLENTVIYYLLKKNCFKYKKEIRTRSKEICIYLIKICVVKVYKLVVKITILEFRREYDWR